MDFLLSYAGKFDMYVEDECAAYVRYCFADPLDAAIFRSRFEPKSARRSGSRVEEPPKGTTIDDSARSPASTKGRAIPKRNCLSAGELLIRRLDQRARPSGDPIPRHPAPPDQKPALEATT
jgi:hypothetical protein